MRICGKCHGDWMSTISHFGDTLLNRTQGVGGHISERLEVCTSPGVYGVDLIDSFLETESPLIFLFDELPNVEKFVNLL